MRAIVIALLAVGVAALPGVAQDERALPRGDNALTIWLDEANIHPPVEAGELTIFPIVLKAERPMERVLTMQAALDRGLLAVAELDPPDVNRARFVNKSARERIFLMAGEVITGGRQNRTIAHDALLDPDSSTVLALYCVQKGRWEGHKDFAAAPAVAPQGVRERAAQSAGQAEVWSEVARANERMGSADASGDLAAALAKPENAKRLDEARRKVVVDLPRGTAGIVVARGGEIVGADLFNSAELFAAMRDRVLESHLGQYVFDGRARAAARPDQMAVRAYLQACYRARFESGQREGAGRIYDVRGARFGQTLVYEAERVIPVAEDRDSDRSVRRPVRVETYMVHTALMQEVVPVRDDPPSRPPPPPRPIPPAVPEAHARAWAAVARNGTVTLSGPVE